MNDIKKNGKNGEIKDRSCRIALELLYVKNWTRTHSGMNLVGPPHISVLYYVERLFFWN